MLHRIYEFCFTYQRIQVRTNYNAYVHAFRIYRQVVLKTYRAIDLVFAGYAWEDLDQVRTRGKF